AGKTASGGKNNNRNRTKKQAQLAKIFTESNTEPRYTSFSAACLAPEGMLLAPSANFGSQIADAIYGGHH
ncbi:MAG TPA: hypothetical protein VHX20_20570, partial [Terracidiphilus sp.]|nr:hypothetical protein [Terracidiphilus sp.]